MRPTIACLQTAILKNGTGTTEFIFPTTNNGATRLWLGTTNSTPNVVNYSQSGRPTYRPVRIKCGAYVTSGVSVGSATFSLRLHLQTGAATDVSTIVAASDLATCTTTSMSPTSSSYVFIVADVIFYEGAAGGGYHMTGSYIATSTIQSATIVAETLVTNDALNSSPQTFDNLRFYATGQWSSSKVGNTATLCTFSMDQL